MSEQVVKVDVNHRAKYVEGIEREYNKWKFVMSFLRDQFMWLAGEKRGKKYSAHYVNPVDKLITRLWDDVDQAYSGTGSGIALANIRLLEFLGVIDEVNLDQPVGELLGNEAQNLVEKLNGHLEKMPLRSVSVNTTLREMFSVKNDILALEDSDFEAALNNREFRGAFRKVFNGSIWELAQRVIKRYALSDSRKVFRLMRKCGPKYIEAKRAYEKVEKEEIN